jgi:hypothetical protein
MKISKTLKRGLLIIIPIIIITVIGSGTARIKRTDLGTSGIGNQCVKKTYCERIIFGIRFESWIEEEIVPCPMRN